MTIDTVLGIAGLAVTILFGLIGVRQLIKRKSQSQNVSGSSIGIQSGRDTKIDG